eukprot:6197868-Pleurochrysis_carterae.AAC.3
MVQAENIRCVALEKAAVASSVIASRVAYKWSRVARKRSGRRLAWAKLKPASRNRRTARSLDSAHLDDGEAGTSRENRWSSVDFFNRIAWKRDPTLPSNLSFVSVSTCVFDEVLACAVLNFTFDVSSVNARAADCKEHHLGLGGAAASQNTSDGFILLEATSTWVG